LEVAISNLTPIKLPSGKVVSLAARFGRLTLDVDLDYVGKTEDEKAWKGIDIIARTIKAIDGKPVAGYKRDQLVVDFSERDITVLVAARARLDTPTPEEMADALEGFESKEALAESVEIYRLTGGAVPFELAMNWPDKKRKLILATLRRDLAALEPGGDMTETAAVSDRVPSRQPLQP
jgi:hypothetical protein